MASREFGLWWPLSIRDAGAVDDRRELVYIRKVFSWDAAKAKRNYEKHGVSFEEAATVFDDSDALEWENIAHSEDERRWTRLGLSHLGRVLFVVYTFRRLNDGIETFRIISARPASNKERKAYAGRSD